jgi:hypothetical protein
VDEVKRALGERGPAWWDDGSPDLNRHMAKNTDYADWYARVVRSHHGGLAEGRYIRPGRHASGLGGSTNIRSAKQAAKYVYGSDNAQSDIVDRHISSDRPAPFFENVRNLRKRKYAVRRRR